MHDTIFEDYPAMFNSERHHSHLADKEQALQKSDAVVFPSVFARNRTREIYDMGGRPAEVIPHAVDALFHAVPTQVAVESLRRELVGGRPFILHVGARYRHKNVARLFQAFSVWSQRKEYALVLAGGGDLEEHDRTLIVSLGLEPDVVVIPRLRDEQLLSAYHAATAFVFPSLSEGFGFPVLEALACGCPVACSQTASLPEVGGSAPIYFDPEEVESIRDALSEVIGRAGDHAHWKQASANALKRSWRDVAEEYLTLYRRVNEAGQTLSATAGART
jgi:glycosyltransferase involved in cell wall biosynthesis